MTGNPLNDEYKNHILKNLNQIKKNVYDVCEQTNRNPNEINLIAVTKTVEPEVVNFAIENGINYLGENKVQEYLSKFDKYSKNVKIDFIGHLQTNKISSIIEKINIIQSVDSFHLATQIDKYAKKINKIQKVLIQINIGKEETKGGILPEEIDTLLKSTAELSNINVLGIMAIPPISTNNYYLEKLNDIFIDIKTKKYDNINMNYLSVGMSNDYVSAIKNGSNIIRIGTDLFGKRNYIGGKQNELI